MFEEENEGDLKDQLDFNLSLEAPTFTGTYVCICMQWHIHYISIGLEQHAVC